MRLLFLAVLLGELAVAAPGLRFEPNTGQADGRAQFVARSTRYNIFLTAAGAILAPRNSAEGVRFRFVDSSPAKLEGDSPLPGVVNYFHGSAPALGNIPTYARVVQHGLYPGIDAVFHGEEGQLEYDFVIAPGADPARILLAFDGARSVGLNDRGEIELLTTAGTLTQRRPILYQEREGQRIQVDGHYEPRGTRQFALVAGKYDRAKPLIVDPTLVFSTSIGGSGPDQVNGLALDSQANIYLAGQTASLDFPVVGGVQGQLNVAYAYRLDNGGTPARLDGVLTSITSLVADPKSPSTVYAATQNGLLKSADSGATWNAIGAGLPSGVISSIVIDPSNSQVIYLAIYNGPGLFKSTDAGLTWTAINNGLVGVNATDIEIFRSAIVIDPFQTSHLFVVTGHGEFETTDGGANWSPYSFPYGFIAFDPSNKGVVYASAPFGDIPTIFKSTDGGVTWKAISTTIQAAVFNLLVDPHNSSTLYVGSSPGILKSTDGGVSWNALNVPSGFVVSQLTADPVVPNTLYAQFYNSLYKTADGGATFSQLATGFSIQTFAVSANGASIYLATTGANNVFVTKFDPTGKTILYSTYIGGSDSDQTAGIAIDGQDNVYVTGITQSPDFPVTAGALKSSGGGPGFVATPGFVFKLNPSGNKLVYSATIDGVTPAAIAVDSEGNAYVTGSTTGGLPVTKGAYWTTPPGCIVTGIFCIAQADEFVLKLNPAGSFLTYATYLNHLFLAGSTGQVGKAIALDSSGNAYVTGLSQYVDRLSADGAARLYSTAMKVTGGGIALDSGNNAYVTGPGALVAKFDPNGAPLFSKSIGNVSSDAGVAIALDAAGDIVVAGLTYSTYFPLFSPLQGMFATETGFLTKLDSTASNLLFSTYVGDSRDFLVSGLALDSSGRAIISGSTFSGAFSQQSSFQDAFVSEYDLSNIPAVRVDNVLNAASLQAGAVSPGEIVTVQGAGFGTAANTQLLFDQRPATLLSVTANRLTAIAPYALDGKTSTEVQLQSAGAPSNPVWFAVASTSPGIYTADGSGTGQALAFNQDGTPNSLSNPAAVGSTITFYATGVGQTIPPGVDGVPHRSAPAAPVTMVAIFIADLYISGPQFGVGPAPGFAADVFTVQAVIPDPTGVSLPSLVPVQIEIGGVTSQGQPPIVGSSTVQIAIKQ